VEEAVFAFIGKIFFQNNIFKLQEVFSEHGMGSEYSLKKGL
jgi:hypothetical protein